MILDNIPAGKELPEDLYAVIEIPQNADPIKYEVDKASGAVFVDRFMATPMFYPCNYGFINHSLSLDGDPIDVLIPTPYPLLPGSVIRCRPVAMLKMTDESVEDLPELLKGQIKHFFEHYKELEAGKWVRVDGWENKAAAIKEIEASIKRYEEQK